MSPRLDVDSIVITDTEDVLEQAIEYRGRVLHVLEVTGRPTVERADCECEHCEEMRERVGVALEKHSTCTVGPYGSAARMCPDCEAEYANHWHEQRKDGWV